MDGSNQWIFDGITAGSTGAWSDAFDWPGVGEFNARSVPLMG